jgi:hypothetical protein
MSSGDLLGGHGIGSVRPYPQWPPKGREPNKARPGTCLVRRVRGSRACLGIRSAAELSHVVRSFSWNESKWKVIGYGRCLIAFSWRIKLLG